LDKFYGGYSIYIRPLDSSTVQTIQKIWILDCACDVHLYYLDVDNDIETAIMTMRAIYVSINYCTIISDTSVSASGIAAHYGSNVEVINCTITNKGNAIVSDRISSVYTENNSGTGNYIGLYANYNSTIGKYGTQPNGTFAEAAFRGSVIR
jgi:hypothetical protein